MNMTIEYLPAYPLAYKRAVGPYGIGNVSVMTELKAWAQAHDLFEEGVIFGIPQDNPTVTLPEDCRYDAAIVVKKEMKLDEAVQAGIFAAGHYAVFQVDHTEQGLSEAWATIYDHLAATGLSLGQGATVERYCSKMVRQHLCEICVPIVIDEGE